MIYYLLFRTVTNTVDLLNYTVVVGSIRLRLSFNEVSGIFTASYGKLKRYVMDIKKYQFSQSGNLVLTQPISI